MTDQTKAPGATTGDAPTSTGRPKPDPAGDGALKASRADDHLSEQYKATQKILAEVNLDSLRSKQLASAQTVLLLADANIPNPQAAVAPGKVVTPGRVELASPVPSTPSALVLEHHDASFFKSDYVHDTERIANVWGNSFTKYLKQGVTDAAKENVETGDWVGKFETAAMIGSAFRTILPKQGVVRAAAATVMAVNMARDLAMPFYHGAKDAVDAKDDRDLDTASRKVSAGVGNFVVDNLIGLPAAGLGEAGTGAILDRAAPKFEAQKTEFWTSDQSKVGHVFNVVADKVDGLTSKISTKINAPDPEVLERAAVRKAISELSPDAKALMLQEAGEHARKHIESAEFYKLGPAILTEAKASEPGPLGGSSVAERPISLGAIRRIKANDLPAKFSTEESDDPTLGHHATVAGKRLSFGRFLDGLESGKSPEVTIFPKTDATTDAPAASIHAGDAHAALYEGADHASGADAIAGPATPRETKTRRRARPDVAISPDELGDAQGSSLARNGGKRTKTGDVPKDGTVKSADNHASDNRTATTVEKAGGDKTAAIEKVKTVSISSPKDDLKPSVFAKVAEVAKAAQELWTPEKIKLADARDQFRGPINATTEMDHAVLPPEYKPSTAQLMDLINQLDSVKNLKAAGMLLMYHMKAANQLLFDQHNVRDLNMLTHELAGVFLKGMRKLGIPEDRQRRIIPSLVTETDDKGSGYFTLPPIDGVIDRPVTVVPRAFTRLISVMTDVIRHEDMGHNKYPELARFPEADRDNLIRGAIAKTIKEEKIPDKTIKMGTDTITTSEFMYRLLKAEANENTADFMGTISGGIGTPASLGVLLQSLRDGGLLETRNVYGKEFEDGIEPHGIDRWRIKFCAETMRQLAPNDKTTTDYADALDQYAKLASRAGDTYTWASTDKPGEKIELPMANWDAIIPRIVKAQLDTPLDTLKDVGGNKHTMREMLGDNFADTVKGIDDLANQFVDAVQDGRTELPGFDKTKYTIGQVFSAGLVAWMRATRNDIDPVESLKAIDKLSGNIRAQYREFNPNAVPLTTPGSVKLMQVLSQSPGQILRVTGAAVADGAPSLRYGADKVAGIMGGTATGDVYAASQWLYKETHDMAARKKEVLGVETPAVGTEKSP